MALKAVDTYEENKGREYRDKERNSWITLYGTLLVQIVYHLLKLLVSSLSGILFTDFFSSRSFYKNPGDLQGP